MKRKFNRDEPDIVHEFKIRTTSDPIKHFKIYNVKEKCQLRKFITRTIGESISQLKNGFVYYRWEEAEEYIRSEREVIVYRKVSTYSVVGVWKDNLMFDVNLPIYYFNLSYYSSFNHLIECIRRLEAIVLKLSSI